MALIEKREMKMEYTSEDYQKADLTGKMVFEGMRAKSVSAIDVPIVDFETEYQLQQFREIESDNFDSDGNKYTAFKLSHHTAEQMLKLINQMEIEIKKYARFTF